MARQSNLFLLTNQKSFERNPLLDKINDSRYRVLEYGKFNPILKGGNILENSLIKILEKYVPEQILSIKEITIWRKATDEIWTNYSEIEIKNHLNLDTFNKADFEGLKIYQLFHDSLYVSAELKNIIIEEFQNIDTIHFSNEYPLYA